MTDEAHARDHDKALAHLKLIQSQLVMMTEMILTLSRRFDEHILAHT
jgi:hypothetical protein